MSMPSRGKPRVLHGVRGTIEDLGEIKAGG